MAGAPLQGLFAQLGQRRGASGNTWSKAATRLCSALQCLHRHTWLELLEQSRAELSGLPSHRISIATRARPGTALLTCSLYLQTLPAALYLCPTARTCTGTLSLFILVK